MKNNISQHLYISLRVILNIIFSVLPYSLPHPPLTCSILSPLQANSVPHSVHLFTLSLHSLQVRCPILHLNTVIWEQRGPMQEGHTLAGPGAVWRGIFPRFAFLIKARISGWFLETESLSTILWEKYLPGGFFQVLPPQVLGVELHPLHS